VAQSFLHSENHFRQGIDIGFQRKFKLRANFIFGRINTGYQLFLLGKNSGGKKQ
jgi:hypothetical protein